MFSSDVNQAKKCTRAVTSLIKSNNESFSVIDAVGIDIQRPTQTVKTLFDNFFQRCFCCKFHKKQRLLRLYSLMYIIHHSINETNNCTA